MEEQFSLEGQIVDIRGRIVFPGRVTISHGKIESVTKLEVAPQLYILPGFIDSHIHIESSLLVPSEFARMASPFGTVATVSDPHEIGNVLGIDGVKYMIEDGEQVNFKFYFGAPSCVPATPFETAGATIGTDGVAELLADNRVKYLAEMMNWPGVLADNAEVLAKLQAAHALGKPVDGHAPGLKGDDARIYAEHGISTDHECYTIEEAQDKIRFGMKVLIREGSAARNFEALYPLLTKHANDIMLCSDDLHPDLLVTGHIDRLVRRAVQHGIDVFNVLQAACINPVKHYNLDVGLLQEGDPADFIVVEDLTEFKVRKTFVNGKLIAQNGVSTITRTQSGLVNKFNTSMKKVEDFWLAANSKKANVIEAFDGELITKKIVRSISISDGYAISDPTNDILKLAVINRYIDTKPAIGFIKNIGLQEGAIASSVGHDSHNITAVGADDESIARAVNLVIGQKGGLAAVNNKEELVLPLPVAGLMSDQDGYAIAALYAKLDSMSKAMGSKLRAPFMTLSFMALLVIPSIKLSDKGLFDGEKFEFMKLFQD